MLLEIDNIELYFKNKRILNGIYLKAETGKITGILGRNGCGKSSLLDIVFGNLKPKYKLIRIDKKPILKPLYKTNLINYLPQYNAVPKWIKLKNLFDWFKVDWDEFANRFEEFRKHRNQKIDELSGGERRFIETYIVLKGKNKIAFLDEPFNGISPLLIEHIKTIIDEEKATKIIVLTDHRYENVIEITDTLYLLNNGSSKAINKLSELEDYGYLNYGNLV